MEEDSVALLCYWVSLLLLSYITGTPELSTILVECLVPSVVIPRSSVVLRGV